MSSLDGAGDDERLRLSPLTIDMPLLMPRGNSSYHYCVPSSVLTVRWATDIKLHGPWTQGTMPRGVTVACTILKTEDFYLGYTNLVTKKVTAI
jgi:hypothetical protein